MGFVYANHRFQKEKEELEQQKDDALKSLALQRENTEKRLGQQQVEERMELEHQKEELQKESEEEKKKTLAGSRSGIKGKVSENIALLVPDFHEQHPDLSISEARFLGEPIDYLFFEGMDDKNITKLVFLEVKSGKNPHLNENEASLKHVIEDAKNKGANVDWLEYIVHDPEVEAAKSTTSTSATSLS